MTPLGKHGGMIVTTTDSVDGYQIARYLSPIFTSVVAGTGFAATWSAGFSDFSSGADKAYEREVASMYDQAISGLKSKASDLGANCIVGARFDLEAISRQNFIMNAFATAVVIKTDQEMAQVAYVNLTASEIQQQKEAERRERFARAGSLSDLLKDPAILTEARKVRRIHGREVGLSYLKQKASELGLNEINLTDDDLPADF